MPLTCPTCHSPDHEVKDTRHHYDYIARRRRCEHCGARFTTTERLVGEMGTGATYGQGSRVASMMARMTPAHRSLVVQLAEALARTETTAAMVQEALAEQEERAQ